VEAFQEVVSAAVEEEAGNGWTWLEFFLSCELLYPILILYSTI